jgi:hypothetical protein
LIKNPLQGGFLILEFLLRKNSLDINTAVHGGQPRTGAEDGNMDCKYFDGCSAPVCPKDPGREKTTWFPDEDICRLADSPDWVKRQRKVSRRAARGGYFTLAMLTHDCRISKGIKGIDPDGTDKERAADEAAWFKAHPVITAENREKNRAVGLKNKGFLDGGGCKNDPPKTGLDGVPGEKGNWMPPNPNRA